MSSVSSLPPRPRPRPDPGQPGDDGAGREAGGRTRNGGEAGRRLLGRGSTRPGRRRGEGGGGGFVGGGDEGLVDYAAGGQGADPDSEPQAGSSALAPGGVGRSRGGGRVRAAGRLGWAAGGGWAAAGVGCTRWGGQVRAAIDLVGLVVVGLQLELGVREEEEEERLRARDWVESGRSWREHSAFARRRNGRLGVGLVVRVGPRPEGKHSDVFSCRQTGRQDGVRSSVVGYRSWVCFFCG